MHTETLIGVLMPEGAVYGVTWYARYHSAFSSITSILVKTSESRRASSSTKALPPAQLYSLTTSASASVCDRSFIALRRSQ
jgi:hypothetical protein